MSSDEHRMQVLYYLKCYKSRLFTDMYNAENEDKSYFQHEISLLEKCIATVCLSEFGHEWKDDEYEVNGNILKGVLICEKCDAIKN